MTGTADIANRPIGIVIPCYGHPQFLVEAVESACCQQIDGKLYVVVVNDGCRFPSSEQATINLLERYPGTLFVTRQANTGLPGARNAGVRFLMQLAPDIDSIFFLDADNRLDPHALAAYRGALGDDPAVGWAYPDITFFGLTWAAEGADVRETAPEYSKLHHMMGNICEAGSLVRADVFRQGVFYDEEMRFGLEDWDFWLSALEAGYMGARVTDAGFMYRRRPESMLAGTRRQEKGLIKRMQDTHAKLFSIKAVRKQEHEEAPCFAIVICDEDSVILTSDPQLQGREMDLAAFKHISDQWIKDYRTTFFPECFLFLTRSQWRALRSCSAYSRWLVWQIRLKGQPNALFRMKDGPFSIENKGEDPEGLPKAAFRSMGHTAIRNAMIALQADPDAELPQSVLNFDISLPSPPACLFEGGPSDGEVSRVLLRLLDNRGHVSHLTRSYSGPNCSRLRSQLTIPICGFEGIPQFPVAHSMPRAVVAVLQKDFSCPERSQLLDRLLGRLAEQKIEVTLIVGSSDPSDDCVVEQTDRVADIVYYHYQKAEPRHAYLGMSLNMTLEPWQIAQLVTIVRSADFFLNFGGSVFLEVAGPSRHKHLKVGVVVPKHCPEEDAKIVAYEHAEEFILVERESDGERLHSIGVPGEKILPFSDLRTRLETGIPS